MRYATSEGYEIEESDLLHSVYDVIGTPYEIVRGTKGWRAREKPIGHERKKWLTPPCESAPQVVTYLYRGGHLRLYRR